MINQAALTAIKTSLSEERRRPSYVIQQADGLFWRCEMKSVKSKPLAHLFTEKEVEAVLAAGVAGRAVYYASR